MDMQSITHDDVLKAIDECRRLGPDELLRNTILENPFPLSYLRRPELWCKSHCRCGTRLCAACPGSTYGS